MRRLLPCVVTAIALVAGSAHAQSNNGTLTLESVLRAPGVLKLAETTVDAEAVWSSVESALKKALGQLVAQAAYPAMLTPARGPAHFLPESQ